MDCRLLGLLVTLYMFVLSQTVPVYNDRRSVLSSQLPIFEGIKTRVVRNKNQKNIYKNVPTVRNSSDNWSKKKRTVILNDQSLAPSIGIPDLKLTVKKTGQYFRTGVKKHAPRSRHGLTEKTTGVDSDYNLRYRNRPTRIQSNFQNKISELRKKSSNSAASSINGYAKNYRSFSGQPIAYSRQQLYRNKPIVLPESTIFNNRGLANDGVIIGNLVPAPVNYYHISGAKIISRVYKPGSALPIEKVVVYGHEPALRAVIPGRNLD